MLTYFVIYFLIGLVFFIDGLYNWSRRPEVIEKPGDKAENWVLMTVVFIGVIAIWPLVVIYLVIQKLKES